MWKAKCQSRAKGHVEENARDRIIQDLRILHNINLSEEEVKKKVLDILKTSSQKEQIECDRDSTIPKYKLYGTLPDTPISVCLYILEHENEHLREIKTLISQNNIMFNKNIERINLNKKDQRRKRIQDKIQKNHSV